MDLDQVDNFDHLRLASYKLKHMARKAKTKKMGKELEMVAEGLVWLSFELEKKYEPENYERKFNTDDDIQ